MTTSVRERRQSGGLRTFVLTAVGRSAAFAVGACLLAALGGCTEGVSTLPAPHEVPLTITDTAAYIADTMVVRAILDSNGLDNISGEAVTSVKDSRISSLDLRGFTTQVTVLPAVVRHLTALEELKLNNTAVSSLPPEIGGLAKLTSLLLIRTRVRALPPEICRCWRLQYLYLTDDSIPSLPDSIGALSALKTLELANNELTALPGSILAISGLQSIGIQGNRLCSVPDSIAGWLNSRSVEGSAWRAKQRCPN